MIILNKHTFSEKDTLAIVGFKKCLPLHPQSREMQIKKEILVR